MDDGSVVFGVQADFSKLQQSLDRAIVLLERFGQQGDNIVNESSQNMQESLNRAFDINRFKNFAVEAGKWLVKFAKETVQSASALREVQNVVDVTFGADANKIEAWAKKARTQFGLTETQAKQFTSTLGAMAKSAGLTGPEIVTMSTDLAGLAADMSSFYNMDFETAFQKIRSGISGETEPLKQLGINMSVANLQAFAMTQGITKAFDKMSQSEQIMLRYQYLMQATADAQGDFVRTSDGFANASRNLENAWGTIKQQIGDLLMYVVEPGTAAIADFLNQLTATPEQTIFDSFADIDANSTSKLAEIEKQAQTAYNIVDTLDKLDGTKAKTALSNVAEGAKGLPAATAQNWEQLYSALQGYTNLSALTGKGEEESHRWLASLAEEARTLKPEDAEAWKTLFDTLKAGLPGLDSEEGQKLIGGLSSAFANGGSEAMSALKINTAELQKYLKQLGISIDDSTDGQEVWLTLCQKLVETIPGLSSIINTETGEIEGGTQAVRAYIKAWQEYSTASVMWEAHRQKGQVIQNAFSDLTGLRLDVINAEANNRDRINRAKDLAKAMGFADVATAARDLYAGSMNGLLRDFGSDEAKEFLSLWGDESTGVRAWAQAVDEYNKRLAEYRKATDEWEREGENLAEVYGEEADAANKAADATEAATKAMTEQVKAASADETALKKIKDQVKNTADAFNDLADYIKKTRDGIIDTLTGNSGGLFEEITTPWEEALKKQQEIKDKLIKETDSKGNLKYSSQEAGELAFTQSGMAGAAKSVTGMIAGLKDQQRYMEEYLALIEKARTLGLDENLLAQLSDGSTTSFDYLTAIAKGNEDSIKQINQSYKAVSDAKNKLADNLTGNKLSVDETYQALQDKANAALQTLTEMTVPAGQAASDTVQAIIDALADGLPGVDTGVSAILTSLSRLTSYGAVGLNFGGSSGGYFSFSSSGSSSGALTAGASVRRQSRIGIANSHDVGLDFTPFDGYLAQLHEGEGILTAEENRIWQQYKNGLTGNANSMDYDTLGSVMRDNVHAGGNVYLDGVTVGRVVSGRQADSYRALERSGWQQ